MGAPRGRARAGRKSVSGEKRAPPATRPDDRGFNMKNGRGRTDGSEAAAAAMNTAVRGSVHSTDRDRSRTVTNKGLGTECTVTTAY